MTKRTGETPRRSLATSLLRALAVSALAIAALGTSAGTTLAFGAPAVCSARAEAPVFSAWGDTSTYFRVPNGGFESGTAEWALANGAAVVAGNEPWRVGGSGDWASLRIPAGGTVESRTICVTSREDRIRLFAYNPRVSGSILHVEAWVQNPVTNATSSTAFDVNADAAPGGWSPTMVLPIPNLLGGAGTQNLTLKFTTRGTPATWQIDDVYVDPFKQY